MKKEQFLKELRIRISDLPYPDLRRSLDYYSEMIDDRIEDGLSEEDAVKKIGTPAMAAVQILQDLPVTTLAKARIGGSRSGLATALIIIGSPIWIALLAVALSLVVTAFAVLFSLIATLLSLVIVLWAVELSFAVGALGATVISALNFLILKNAMFGIFGIGCALILFALSVFGYYMALYGSKGLLHICGYMMQANAAICRFIKFCLIRKEAIR